MKQRYLEVTFRNGKPVAAYLYLPRRDGEGSVRTEKRSGGMVIDYAADGRAIGIEILSPATISLANLNAVLDAIHAEPATREEFAPLAA